MQDISNIVSVDKSQSSPNPCLRTILVDDLDKISVSFPQSLVSSKHNQQYIEAMHLTISSDNLLG